MIISFIAANLFMHVTLLIKQNDKVVAQVQATFCPLVCTIKSSCFIFCKTTCC